MSFVVTTAPNKFTPVSEGLHAAVLAKIIDRGTEETPYGPKHKAMFIYVTDELDEEGQPKLVFATYTVSVHEKSKLRKVILALGKEVVDNQFDLDLLLGTQTQLVVEQRESQTGRMYANIQGYLKANPKTYVTIPEGWDFTPKAKDDAITDKDISF